MQYQQIRGECCVEYCILGPETSDIVLLLFSATRSHGPPLCITRHDSLPSTVRNCLLAPFSSVPEARDISFLTPLATAGRPRWHSGLVVPGCRPFPRSSADGSRTHALSFLNNRIARFGHPCGSCAFRYSGHPISVLLSQPFFSEMFHFTYHATKSSDSFVTHTPFTPPSGPQRW